MLRLRDIRHDYAGVEALRGVSLDVGADEILCLLGPSGCGKTTLLRIVAGLIPEYRGQVEYAGQDLRHVPAHERGFGLVFQDFALFPHLTVAQNIAYGLRRQGKSKSECEKRTGDLLQRVDLSGFAERDIATLSGGEKQRVALARSLAPRPRLLMLDEPLGSLDARLRDQLALDLRAIIKEARVGAIYVTHDQREAYAIADRIAVMQAGAAQQIDRPRALYQNPATAFVARFLGLPNVFRFDANSITRELRRRACPDAASGERFLIHPDGIALAQQNESRSLRLTARTESIIFRGDHSEVHLRLADDMPLVCLARADEAAIQVTSLQVFIQLDAVRRLR